MTILDIKIGNLHERMILFMRPENVRQGIAHQNLWYTASQFQDQMENLTSRHVIEGRWRAWAFFLDQWLASRREARVGLPMRILDAGCGDGINLAWLAREFACRQIHAELTGMDYNPLRLERAQAMVPEARTIVASLDSIPCRAASFDFVLCSNVMEHIRDDEAFLKELVRIMALGAILILGVPNEGCLLARIRNNILQRSIKNTTDHVNFYTWATLQTKLRQASLEPVNHCASGFFMPHLRVSQMIGRSSLGQMLIAFLGRLMPSQAADLSVFCRVWR